MGRRALRGIGAGLMEIGNQTALMRREELEKRRQDNLLKIQEGRLDLMREQNADTKEFRAESMSDSRYESFAKKSEALTNKVYGKEGMNPQQFKLLSALIEGGLPMKEAQLQIAEQFGLDATTDPDMRQLAQYHKGLENIWGRTIGKGKDEMFNLGEVLSTLPPAYAKNRDPNSVPELGEIPEAGKIETFLDWIGWGDDEKVAKAKGDESLDLEVEEGENWPSDRSPEVTPGQDAWPLMGKFGITKTKPDAERIEASRKAYGRGQVPDSSAVVTPTTPGPRSFDAGTRGTIQRGGPTYMAPRTKLQEEVEELINPYYE